MSFKLKLILFWLAGALLIIGKYLYDKSTINCEPCLTDAACPPCQTGFMANTWLFITVWNVIIVVIILLYRKKK